MCVCINASISLTRCDIYVFVQAGLFPWKFWQALMEFNGTLLSYTWVIACMNLDVNFHVNFAMKLHNLLELIRNFVVKTHMGNSCMC